jgi:hypothetical protein
MTYISSFRCDSGLVMCADTLETEGEYKNYVEEIEIVEDQSYPLAIGGAGADDILKPFMQEIIDRVIKSKPRTKVGLQNEIKATIKTVYENDIPVLILKKQHLTPHFLNSSQTHKGRFLHLPRFWEAALQGTTPSNYWLP